MKIQEYTMYACLYCGHLYKDLKAVTRCLERCSKKQALRLQWFKANPPKYKVGDFVYSLPSGRTILVESISKHSRDKCWMYHGTDLTGFADWFGSLYAQLLVSRLEADARRLALTNRLQGYTIEDVFFAARVKHTDTGVEVNVVTHVALKDKDYTWKQ